MTNRNLSLVTLLSLSLIAVTGCGGGDETGVIRQEFQTFLNDHTKDSRSAWTRFGEMAESRVSAWEKAAKGGMPEAQVFLGRCYYHGYGVAKSDTEAMNWYRKAAEQGLAFAQHELAICYWSSIGVSQDEAEAVKWHRKAAEQGFAASQNSLATMYHFGQGVSEDEAEAVKWYRKAAEQGNLDAAYSLGELYYFSKDYTEAARWLRIVQDHRLYGESATEMLKAIEDN